MNEPNMPSRKRVPTIRSGRKAHCSAIRPMFLRPLRFESLEARSLLSVSGLTANSDPSLDLLSADFQQTAPNLSLESEIVYRTYGIDFSPYIAPGEDPNRGDGQITELELWQRLEVIAPHTDWVRFFGCNADLNKGGEFAHALGNSVAVGAWIGRDLASNQAQIDSLVDLAIQGHVDLAIVGSETLLRGDVTTEVLIGYINEVQTRLAEADVSIPVTTADVYGVLLSNPEVVDAVDVVLVNYYPFWEGSSIDTAVARLHRWHQQMITLGGQKEVIVSETGWPSSGEPFGAAVPSPENAAYYFLNFVSWARANGVKYFYFEAYDEPWKAKHEGARGAYWGVFDTSQTLKPGMDRVFSGETLPDNWTDPPGPPIIDFFGLPDTIDTNIATFVVAGRTDPNYVVKLNGDPLPSGSVGSQGEFAHTVALSSGQNVLVLTIESDLGEEIATASKAVVFDAGLSTSGPRLLYVDVVPGDSSEPSLNGTVVIDLDRNAVLGLLEGQHVRGIAPDAAEIYMSDHTVISTANHQPLRTLPFSQDIPSNSFLVSPLGDRLYARNEVCDVQANVLLEPLPTMITTGSSWSSASIPGGPAITADGAVIYAGNSVAHIDPVAGTVTSTDIIGYFMSDIALSPDGRLLLVSEYSYNSGRLDVYDTNTFELLTTISGLGDFAGEIRFLSDNVAVVGSSGNPAFGSGGISLIDLDELKMIQRIPMPLADNVATSGANEVFVSTGAIDALTGERFGIDVWVLGQEGRLYLAEHFFLGINRYVPATGRPRNDQIRRVILKPALPVGVISGQKFEDADGDGMKETGEAGLAGWTIYLDANDNGQLDTGETSVQTDVSGYYSFTGLGPGPHIVREVVEDGWQQTCPAAGFYSVTLTSGQQVADRDFGNFDSGSISGQKFEDTDGDGVKEAGERGLDGWTIYLDANENGQLDTGETSVQTDASGHYSFAGLGSGPHVVREVVEDGWQQTCPAAGFYSVTLTSGQQVADRDFGNRPAPLIDVALIPVLDPSPSSLPGSTLPTPAEEVAVGSSYYLEVWVQDKGSPGVGVTGGTVCVQYTTLWADATAVVNLDFDILTSGAVDDPNGLVNNLGGGTLTAGVAISPDWARLAYIEVVPTAVGDVTFRLSPGELEFSRYGEGAVPWNQVDSSDVVAVNQVPGIRVDTTLAREPTIFDDTGAVDTLPRNLNWIDEWGCSVNELDEADKGPFYVEIWSESCDPRKLGVTSFLVDLAYNTELFTATSIEYGPAFTENPTGAILDAEGLVDDLGGSTALPKVGVNSPVLLARVLFEAAQSDDGCPHNAQGKCITPFDDPGIGLLNVSIALEETGSTEVELGSPPQTDVWPVMYDIDDDGRVAFGDLAFFATAFQQEVGTLGAEFAWASDFDRSGVVDFGDLSFFAANFSRCKTDPIPLLYPANFPDDWETGTQGAAGFQELAAALTLRAADRASLHGSALEPYADPEADGNPAQLSEDVLAYACWAMKFDRMQTDSTDSKDVPEMVDFLLAEGCW